MIKKAFLSLLLICMIMTASCSQYVEDVMPEDLCMVTLALSEEKPLVATIPDGIARYEYKAIPHTYGIMTYDADGLNLASRNGASVTSSSVTATVSLAGSDTVVTVTGTASSKATLRVASRQLTADDIGRWTLIGSWSGTNNSTSNAYHQVSIRTSASGTLVSAPSTDLGGNATIDVSQTYVSNGYWICYEIVVPSGYNCTSHGVSFKPYLVKGDSATPMKNEIYGACDWTQFIPDAAGKASLGYFSQGIWEFHVRAIGETGNVLYNGNTTDTVYLRKGFANVIAMVLQMPSNGEKGYATITFDVETPALEAKSSSLNYTMRCHVTPLTYDLDTEWRNNLGAVRSSTSMTWGTLTGVLKMNTSGNTASPVINVRQYVGNSASDVIASGIVPDTLQHGIVRLTKTSLFDGLSIVFDGNSSDAEIVFDLSSVPNGLYWLHYDVDSITPNGMQISNVMLTSSRIDPYGFSPSEGYLIRKGARRTLSELSWTVTDHGDSSNPASGENAMRFRSSLGGFDQGVYLVETELIYNPTNTHIAGQMLLVRLISGATTSISGKLDGGAYINASFDVTENKKEISGYITCAGHIRTDVTGNHGALAAASGEQITLSYVAHADSEPVTRIDWYLDGVRVLQNSMTWTTSSTSVGEHEVCAVLWNADMQKTGTATAMLFIGV